LPQYLKSASELMLFTLKQKDKNNEHLEYNFNKDDKKQLEFLFSKKALKKV
jgi:hypothetical protein